VAFARGPAGESARFRADAMQSSPPDQRCPIWITRDLAAPRSRAAPRGGVWQPPLTSFWAGTGRKVEVQNDAAGSARRKFLAVRSATARNNGGRRTASGANSSTCSPAQQTYLDQVCPTPGLHVRPRQREHIRSYGHETPRLSRWRGHGSGGSHGRPWPAVPARLSSCGSRRYGQQIVINNWPGQHLPIRHNIAQGRLRDGATPTFLEAAWRAYSSCGVFPSSELPVIWTTATGNIRGKNWRRRPRRRGVVGNKCGFMGREPVIA